MKHIDVVNMTHEEFMALCEQTHYYEGDNCTFMAAPGTPFGAVSHVWDPKLKQWVIFRGDSIRAGMNSQRITKEEAEY